MRDYAVVTGTYWAFTITDGALRMLVLLYLFERGFNPLELASLFVLYEFLGVLTNAFGGWVGARFGLARTLFAGMSLQIAACLMLTVDPDLLVVPYVMLAQGISGVAKDLTKMSSKSFVKQVVPADQSGRLLRLVSLLTGSKNTLKGIGFFVGGFLLSNIGFRSACIAMASMLAVALVSSAFLLPANAGRVAGAKFSSVFSDDARINWLAAARLFLFGSRDLWFAIALPVFLSASLGWSHSGVGGFLALWIIGYGILQASAPRWTQWKGAAPGAYSLVAWTATLLLPLGAIGFGLVSGWPATATLIIGLAVFAFVFATNSAVHSYLIVAYADDKKVAMNIGFYYAANAMGRLAGTVLSGTVFQFFGAGVEGLAACVLGAACFALLSSLLCLPLGAAERRRLPTRA